MLVSFKHFAKPRSSNDNFSHATNQKWKKWLADNPGHPSRHKVAARVQKAEQQLAAVDRRKKGDDAR